MGSLHFPARNHKPKSSRWTGMTVALPTASWDWIVWGVAALQLPSAVQKTRPVFRMQDIERPLLRLVVWNYRLALYQCSQKTFKGQPFAKKKTLYSSNIYIFISIILHTNIFLLQKINCCNRWINKSAHSCQQCPQRSPREGKAVWWLDIKQQKAIHQLETP